MNKKIIIAVSFIATIALAFWLVLPKYESLKSKMSEKRIKEVNLENKKEYYKRVSEISNELKNYSEEISKIDFALPQEISLPAMYGFFQKRASESGLVLKNENFNSKSISKDNLAVKEYRFDLELAGSYSVFKNFLTILEKSAKIIEVESISFSAPAEDESPFLYSVAVKFYSY